MKYITSIFLIINHLVTVGQSISPQVINSAGGTGTVGTTGIQISYNIGEPLVSTIQGNSNIITQGFLQSNEDEFGFTASAFITPNSCADKTDGSVTITSKVVGANQNDFQFFYYWSPSSVCSSVATCSVVENLPAGTYSVLVIAHYAGLGAAIPDDSTSLNSIVVAGSSEPCQIKVYNGVTPNGDNQNDFFYIENIDQFPNNHVEIYNRWGQKLSDIKNYNNIANYWAGTSGKSTEIAPSGTYFYVIELGNGTAPIKGWFRINKY